MRIGVRTALFVAIALTFSLLAGAACGGDQPTEPVGQTKVGGDTAANKNAGDSAVTGAITYRERIALAPDAVVEVELRDVSLVDAPSRLIAQQVIRNPGQVPIPFRVEYDRDDISSGNVYAVQARIMYGDGSLAFTNDTAYEVITQGRPSEVDMTLVMVSPPPDPNAASPDAKLPGDWVVIPAAIRGVKVVRSTHGYVLTVTHFLPGGSDCARLDSSRYELVDRDFYTTVNVLEKRSPDGSLACASPPREGAVELEVKGPLAPGETYRVRINDRLMAVFTPPREGLRDPVVALSPIESADLVILEIYPPVYNVVVTSALPKGSGCSQFNGFTIELSGSDRIDLQVTHHETTDPNVACTADYPMVDTTIPLGSDFESGVNYTVFVNGSDPPITFQAQ